LQAGWYNSGIASNPYVITPRSWGCNIGGCGYAT
jgi:hypothetical protein